MKLSKAAVVVLPLLLGVALWLGSTVNGALLRSDQAQVSLVEQVQSGESDNAQRGGEVGRAALGSEVQNKNGNAEHNALQNDVVETSLDAEQTLLGQVQFGKSDNAQWGAEVGRAALGSQMQSKTGSLAQAVQSNAARNALQIDMAETSLDAEQTLLGQVQNSDNAQWGAEVGRAALGSEVQDKNGNAEHNALQIDVAETSLDAEQTLLGQVQNSDNAQWGAEVGRAELGSEMQNKNGNAAYNALQIDVAETSLDAEQTLLGQVQNSDNAQWGAEVDRAGLGSQMQSKTGSLAQAVQSNTTRNALQIDMAETTRGSKNTNGRPPSPYKTLPPALKPACVPQTKGGPGWIDMCTDDCLQKTVTTKRDDKAFVSVKDWQEVRKIARPALVGCYNNESEVDFPCIRGGLLASPLCDSENPPPLEHFQPRACAKMAACIDECYSDAIAAAKADEKEAKATAAPATCSALGAPIGSYFFDADNSGDVSVGDAFLLSDLPEKWSPEYGQVFSKELTLGIASMSLAKYEVLVQDYKMVVHGIKVDTIVSWCEILNALPDLPLLRNVMNTSEMIYSEKACPDGQIFTSNSKGPDKMPTKKPDSCDAYIDDKTNLPYDNVAGLCFPPPWPGYKCPLPSASTCCRVFALDRAGCKRRAAQREALSFGLPPCSGLPGSALAGGSLAVL